MKQSLENLKSKQNYFVDLILFLPFFMLLITGIIMLTYHTGKSYSSEIVGLNGNKWLVIHKILTIVVVPIVIIHLILHYDWFKRLFTLKLKNKHSGQNIALFILFLLCVFTSLFSWFIFPDSNYGRALRGIHNKFGLVLIIFFVIHVKHYFQWLIHMTKKGFKKGT